MLDINFYLNSFNVYQRLANRRFRRMAIVPEIFFIFKIYSSFCARRSKIYLDKLNNSIKLIFDKFKKMLDIMNFFIKKHCYGIF